MVIVGGASRGVAPIWARILPSPTDRPLTPSVPSGPRDTENRPDTNGGCEPVVAVTQDIWELCPMQSGNGTPGPLEQWLPPGRAAPTRGYPMDERTRAAP